MSILSTILKNIGGKILGKKYSWIIPLATLFLRKKTLSSKKKISIPPSPDYLGAAWLLASLPALRYALPMPTVGLMKVTSDIPKMNKAFDVALALQLRRKVPFMNLADIKNSLNVYNILHDVITKSFLREAEAKGQGTVTYKKYRDMVNDWTAQALMGWWYWNKNNKKKNAPTIAPTPLSTTYVDFSYDVDKPIGWW